MIIKQHELGIVLCNHTGFIGPWIISAIISDGSQDIYATWYISYEVWHPPIPVAKEDETKDSAFEFDVTTTQMIILGLGALIAILLVMLVLGRRKPPQAKQSMFVDSRYEPKQSQYSAVPGAPSLPRPVMRLESGSAIVLLGINSLLVHNIDSNCLTSAFEIIRDNFAE